MDAKHIMAVENRMGTHRECSACLGHVPQERVAQQKDRRGENHNDDDLVKAVEEFCGRFPWKKRFKMWLCYIFGHKWKIADNRLNMYTLGTALVNEADFKSECSRCGATGKFSCKDFKICESD